MKHEGYKNPVDNWQIIHRVINRLSTGYKQSYTKPAESKMPLCSYSVSKLSTAPTTTTTIKFIHIHGD